MCTFDLRRKCVPFTSCLGHTDKEQDSCSKVKIKKNLGMTKFYPFGILWHSHKKPLISIKYLSKAVSSIRFSSFPSRKSKWQLWITKWSPLPALGKIDIIFTIITEHLRHTFPTNIWICLCICIWIGIGIYYIYIYKDLKYLLLL